MFGDVINGLKNGLFPPDLTALKKRFNIAIIKKLAVLKLPSQFWSNDPKINPSIEQLACVAFILEDGESLSLVELAVAHEISGKLRGKESAHELDSLVRARLKIITDTFLGFATDKAFLFELSGKVKRCGSSLNM
nr:hypothetical protein [Desulfobulbaceae bacterium]